MQTFRNFIDSPRLRQFAQITSIILAISTFGGWLLNFLNLASKIPLSLITDHTRQLFDCTISFVIFFLGLSYWRLSRRFSVSFKDDFKDDITNNWEFEGKWIKIEKGVLCVTDSDPGGITKSGSLWENYEFEFETKIINKCSSWVVRAQDLNNYFMFQCGPEMIKPHHRATVPKIEQRTPAYVPEGKSGESTIQISYETGWQIWNGVPHNSNLTDWVKVRIRVYGSEVKIWIGKELVYHESNLIPYATGRVGFRNWGDEEAHFKKVRVRPLS